MNSQEDFLKIILEKLDQQRIPYMLAGSIASSLHGQPRATKDVDIVIAPAEKQLTRFVESLGEDYYVSPEAARNAFAQNSMFNVIDNQSGWKADFIIRKDRPFGHQEFERRCTAKIGGLDVWATSPEDTILTKLEWAKDNQSEQQLRDALSIVIVQWYRLDMDYLKHWAVQLEIENSLKELFNQARELVESNKEKDFGK